MEISANRYDTNEKNSKTAIAIYSRKSKFTGKGESIENQIDMCKKYINNRYNPQISYNGCNHHRNYIAESYSDELYFSGKNSISDISQDSRILIYQDEGFSGGNLNRPKFIEMMHDAEDKKIKAIVVYRLDRISRNTADFVKLIEKLEKLEIDFISIKEQFDTSTPMGRAMMYMSSVFSQLERETIAERIRDNMHELAKTGRWLGGITPTGYKSESFTYTDISGKNKKACRLVIVPKEAAAVTTIFETFLSTTSLTETESLLACQGFRTKNNRAFTRFSIKNILTNPVYMKADKDAFTYLESCGVNLNLTPLSNSTNFNNYNNFNFDNCHSYDKSLTDFDTERGIMVYNRTLQRSGRSHKQKPMSEWIAAIGQHKGLISAKDWIMTQEILAGNKIHRKKSSKTPPCVNSK